MQRQTAIDILNQFIQNVAAYVDNGGRLPVEEVWLYGSLLDPTEKAPNDVDLYVAYPEEDYWFLNENAFEEERRFKEDALKGTTNIQLDVNDLHSVHNAELVIERPSQDQVRTLVWQVGDTTKEWKARVDRAISRTRCAGQEGPSSHTKQLP